MQLIELASIRKDKKNMAISESQITICGHGSGRPSLKNMQNYLSSRYASLAKNGAHKGLIAIRRLKALTDDKRIEFAKTYKTIIGRNYYNQDLRNYVYHPYTNKLYYSDCSSSICATFHEIGYDISNLNTAGIYNSDLFENVKVSIVNGHVQDTSKLKVGDCLLFVGEDPSRPKQIGHVEAIYSIPTEDITYPETTIDATFTITASELNIRKAPSTNSEIVGTYKQNDSVHSTSKSGDWFKTDKGWISRKYCVGWILESERYWYMDEGVYPIHCAMDIGGKEYHFDKEGWMITQDRVSISGSIKY